MKYNIIGDIHGRTNWKNTIISEGINIFVGDYFSPYDENITWEQQKQNFLDIITFKKEHPETILLIGNHDEDHWHWCTEYANHCSRHNYANEKEIKALFEEYEELFQAAYSIENKALVTHAGMSIEWYFKYAHGKDNIWCYHHKNLNALCYYNEPNIEAAYKAFENNVSKDRPGIIIDKPKIWELCIWKNKWYYYNEGYHEFTITPDEAAQFINDTWKNNPNCFSFEANADYCDCYGETPVHSPMWIRIGCDEWSGLNASNIFKGTDYIQIFGHTINQDIREYWDTAYDGQYWHNQKTGHMIMVDCLEVKDKSYIFETL